MSRNNVEEGINHNLTGKDFEAFADRNPDLANAAAERSLVEPSDNEPPATGRIVNHPVPPDFHG